MKAVCFIRSLVLLLFVPAYTLLCSIITVLLVAPFMPRRVCDQWIKFWARVVIKVSGTRVHVEGLENLKEIKSCILVSNHLSHYDIPILFLSLPISFRMVGKMELFRMPLFGQAMRALGFVPVVRDNSEGSQKIFREMEKKFSLGQSVWMAPEGTRFQGAGIGQFKTGAFYLALRTGQPIVPVCIYGTDKVLGKNSLLINVDTWNRDVQVRVLPAFEIAKDDRRSRKELRDEVREKLVAEFSRFHTSNGGRDPLNLVEDSGGQTQA